MSSSCEGSPVGHTLQSEEVETRIHQPAHRPVVMAPGCSCINTEYRAKMKVTARILPATWGGNLNPQL
ncbi:hypothetical protein ATANTOWER_012230 [Ataeniobius toweri]|uniref:Uncharacterized protein n=1 Tax=Ataeniobius toweri TaxID=208326 RepID=A0ABU7BFL2_9TELE|nr:hypothetical protein [Ataeniobius toweri]